MNIRYCLYGNNYMASITHDQIIAEVKKHANLIARAENSGCEGTYVEIAKWNEDTERWERYAFEKFFGGELDAITSSVATAEAIAAQINIHNRQPPFIHDLPNWGTPKTKRITRAGMEADKFEMPEDIIHRAKTDTKAGEQIGFTPEDMLHIIEIADKALDGDSNDAEHDALYQIRELLSDAFEEPNARIRRK